MIKKSKAVILLSGGMDSALTLAIAIELGYTPAVLHLNYRQKTEEKELQCFLQLAEQYKIQERLIVDIEYLRQIGKSSLTDDNIPVTNADLNSKEIPSSYEIGRASCRERV